MLCRVARHYYPISLITQSTIISKSSVIFRSTSYLVRPVCLSVDIKMQSTISSFFKPKSAESTPEKSKSTPSSTPTKVTPKKTPEKSPKAKTPVKSPKSATKKNATPDKSTTPSKEKKVASKEEDEEESKEEVEVKSSPTKEKTPEKKRSPSPAKSRKRKAAGSESEEENTEAPTKKAKEDKEDKEPEVTTKRSFSSDALLDDDDTLANIDLDPVAVKKNAQPTSTVTTTKQTSAPTTSTPTPTASSSSTSKSTSVSTPTKSSGIVNMSAKPAGIFQLGGGTPESVTRLTNLITDASWKEVLKAEFKKPYFTTLAKFLEGERGIKNNHIFPPEPMIFNALNHASLDKVRVVILGQDPYHNHNQAMGFSFSVQRGITPPPSLKNIFKELADDIPDFKAPGHGDLTKWADQGVLLLNAVLTVRVHEPNSHKGKGWENLTSAVINAINTKKQGVVFMLWGKDAQTAAASVDTKKHLVLKSVHPSPYSADKGFFGCKHFSKANKYLEERGRDPVDWTL